MVEIKDANGSTITNTYDALSRLIQVSTTEGRSTQTQYDANGNATHTIDANATADASHPRNDQGASVYREYDELNRLVLERDALNGETTYTYDLLGNVTSITDAENQKTTFIYDDLGRLTQIIDPAIESGIDKTDRVLLYDEAGNVLLTEDRSGRQRRHSYDVLNRLTRSDYLLDGSYDLWNYDDFGDLVVNGNNEVTYSYSYTPRHELASKTDNRLGKSLAWTYDPVGNVQSKIGYEGTVTSFQYDSTNRLVAMQNPSFLHVSYFYDGAGRLINRILSNGAKTRYAYDDDHRLVQLDNHSANDTPIQRLSYARDEVGNITQIVDSVAGRTINFEYDALYRLISADSSTDTEDRTYTYDAVGNRKTVTANGVTFYYCYNDNNCDDGPQGNRLANVRINAMSGPLHRQFTYDDSGRVTAKRDGDGQDLYTIAYNGKGRARQINAITFDYDPNDYRVRNGGKLHHLQGEHLEASYDSSGLLQKRYFRGVIIDELVNGYVHHSSNPNDWTNYTFHHDHINSITALTGHSGAIEETNTYDTFGSPLIVHISGAANDLLFTGREFDPSTGLYYYRARYYDPDIGRFLSEDPLGFEADINFYTYVRNNPVNFNDPSGKIIPAIAAGCAAAPYACAAAVSGITSVVTGGVMRGGLAAAEGKDIASAVLDPSSVALDAGLGATIGVGAQAINIGRQLSRVGSAAVPGRVLGEIGEGLAGIPSTGKTAIKINGRTRFPDQRIGGNIIEVKNTASIRSRDAAQIRDFVSFAGSNNGSVTVLTRGKSTDVSRIQGLVDDGAVSIGKIPGINSSGVGNLSTGTLSLLGIGAGAASNAAGGGFVLYPSKPNTSMTQSVYSK